MYTTLGMQKGVSPSDLIFGHFIAVFPAILKKGDAIKELHARAQGEVTLREALQVRALHWRLYWRFCCNIVAEDLRSSATILQQNLQYNLVYITPISSKIFEEIRNFTEIVLEILLQISNTISNRFVDVSGCYNVAIGSPIQSRHTKPFGVSTRSPLLEFFCTIIIIYFIF
jgi:hypothetical protein